MTPGLLRIGTRGSKLAMAQSSQVAEAIRALHPDLHIEMHTIHTTGDQVAHKQLRDVGGKGLFTREIEHALLRDEIDLAIHSYKDVPVTQPLAPQDNLAIVACPKREDARDVLVSKHSGCLRWLPEGSRIGTGSLRRKMQLLSIRHDLMIEPMRGNIDTRLRKLCNHEADGIVLALAGLYRMGAYEGELAGLLEGKRLNRFECDEMVPAAGQGALALQCRRDDFEAQQIAHALHDDPTELCVHLERRAIKELDADCDSPVGIFAQIDGQHLEIHAAVGSHKGELGVLRHMESGPASEAETLVDDLLRHLMRNGAGRLLHG